MSNLQRPHEDNIANASDRVVVVAARFALTEYLNHSVYICLPHRSIQECMRMGFYTKNIIDRHFPKILGKVEAIARDEIDTRTDLPEVDKTRLLKLRTQLEKTNLSRSEEWSKEQLKIIFLSPPDSPDTFILAEDVINDGKTKSGQSTAFTQQQRYISLARLEKEPKTTSELL